MSQLWPATVAGIVFGSIYALMAIGYTAIYRVCRVINFAHAEVFMIGTFGALFATQWFGISPGPHSIQHGVGLVLILIGAGLVAVALSAFTSTVLDAAVFRPLRRRGGGPAAGLIASLGVSLFLQELFGKWQGRYLLPFPRLLADNTLFTVFGTGIRVDQVLVVGVAIVVMFAIDRFITSSRLGFGIRATAEDSDTALLMGVNRDRVVMVTFLLAGVSAGVAGLLLMILYENTYFFIGFAVGIKALTAALLGGMGNIRGAIVGAYVLGLAENYGSIVFGAEWKDAIVFALLMLGLMFRPTGILGTRLQTVRV